jgi:hypothetical protein
MRNISLEEKITTEKSTNPITWNTSKDLKLGNKLKAVLKTLKLLKNGDK